MLSLLHSSRARLVVLPELFSTGYLFTSREEAEELSEEIPGGKTSRRLADFCREKNIYIVAGIAEKAGRECYNSAALFGPEGHCITYRKIHLFQEEKDWFAPGNLPLSVTSVDDLRVGIMICFDWIFPETARVLSLLGADIICHPANLVLPYCPDAMITRSIENRVYSITANRTGTEERGGKKLHYIGKSQIVDPLGRRLIQSNEKETTIGETDIESEQARNKNILERNHLMKDRRPEYYRLIGEHFI